jgi:hypothetical protein
MGYFRSFWGGHKKGGGKDPIFFKRPSKYLYTAARGALRKSSLRYWRWRKRDNKFDLARKIFFKSNTNTVRGSRFLDSLDFQYLTSEFGLAI